MKKIIFILMILIAFSTNSEAQNDTTTARKNIVKINFSSVMFKTACLQYERLLSKKTSVALNLLYRPNSIFSPALFIGSYSFTEEFLSVAAITPSVRYYFGKKPNQGFYCELYGRYRCDALTSKTVPAVFNEGTFYQKTKENIFVAGALLGCQIYMRDNLIIDFWILGLGIGKTSYTSTSNFEGTIPFEPMTQSIKERYEKILRNDYGEAGTITWEGKQVKYSESRLLIPPRGFGVNVGIRF